MATFEITVCESRAKSQCNNVVWRDELLQFRVFSQFEVLDKNELITLSGCAKNGLMPFWGKEMCRGLIKSHARVGAPFENAAVRSIVANVTKAILKYIVFVIFLMIKMETKFWCCP